MREIGQRVEVATPALDALLAYAYPGNVRELMNICERIVVMSETELVDVQDLPGEIVAKAEDPQGGAAHWPDGMSLQQVLDKTERAILAESLGRYGNQCRIAEALGVNQSTVARKLKKHGLA